VLSKVLDVIVITTWFKDLVSFDITLGVLSVYQIMGKEEKEKKLKREIDKEYLKWPIVEYALQNVKFFEEVKQLHVASLDPKFELTNEHVTTTNIAKVFGNVHKVKTVNPLLRMEIKRELEPLY
jgi:galactitol-specific phosphotransferase system IIB component